MIDIKVIDTKKIGRRIRELREQRKMTLRQLAAVAGMHHTYMHRIEKGEMSPTIRTLQKIANALSAELNVTVNKKSLTLEEEVVIEDETLIKRIISYTKVIKDTEKKELIVKLLRETMSTEIVTYFFDSQSEWLVLYSLQYDINANSYKLTKTKEYAPVERKDGYIAVKIEQPLPFSRFDKDDIAIFKKEDKIANPNETVLIKFDKEKIFLGTYRDFITANPDPNKDTEKYRIAYIIPF
jgi:transcriptional regulator with XRE-family HTH domain